MHGVCVCVVSAEYDVSDGFLTLVRWVCAQGVGRGCVEAAVHFLQGGPVATEFEYFQQLASNHLASISTDLDLLTAARELQSHSMVFDIEVPDWCQIGA